MFVLYTVRLNHPPIITDGPRNRTAHVGESVRFTCRLLSDPEYHLQWHKHVLANRSYVSVNFTEKCRVVRSEVNAVGKLLIYISKVSK